MSSTTASCAQEEPVIKIEDAEEPDVQSAPIPPPVKATASAPPVHDPKDPEGFLRRCSGYNKKKGVRCGAAIGRNSHYTRMSHATYLPTCHAHRDQQSYAGWCQLVQEGGVKCGRLFRWTPPYFELCEEHQGHPNTPCYFFKLPLEIRQMVLSFLLPSKPISSSTSALHAEDEAESVHGWRHAYGTSGPTPSAPRSFASLQRTATTRFERGILDSKFPMPLLDLLLVNRQMSAEVKDILFSTVSFTIDIRKDGTFLCGRRLLEPKRADGSQHFVADDIDKLKGTFLRTFDFTAVKNYNVHILVEDWQDEAGRTRQIFPWDEEVEIFDIRDYVGVVVSGILCKSRNLCKLNVKLGFYRFNWDDEHLLTNIKTLVAPFMRLRNVRQPRLCGVFDGSPLTNFMITLPLVTPTSPCGGTGSHQSTPARVSAPICSIPSLPTQTLIPICNSVEFKEYRSKWQRAISNTSSHSTIRKPPIRLMFTEFKNFFTRLSKIVPDVTARTGRHAFLHCARVAREREDVEAFRHLRNELILYWQYYLDLEERRKEDMNIKLSRMFDADVYPATAGEDTDSRRSSKSTASAAESSAHSPVVLDVDAMNEEGIPLQFNSIRAGPSLHEIRIMHCHQRRMTQAIAGVGSSSSRTMQAGPRPQQVACQLAPAPAQDSDFAQSHQKSVFYEMQQKQQVLAWQQRQAQQPAVLGCVMPQPQVQRIHALAAAPSQDRRTELGALMTGSWQRAPAMPPSWPPLSDAVSANECIVQDSSPEIIDLSYYDTSRKRQSETEIDEGDTKKMKTPQRSHCMIAPDIEFASVAPREVNENGDEIMVLDVCGDWTKLSDQTTEKGKGKERMLEEEVVWIE